MNFDSGVIVMRPDVTDFEFLLRKGELQSKVDDVLLMPEKILIFSLTGVSAMEFTYSVMNGLKALAEELEVRIELVLYVLKDIEYRLTLGAKDAEEDPVIEVFIFTKACYSGGAKLTQLMERIKPRRIRPA